MYRSHGFVFLHLTRNLWDTSNSIQTSRVFSIQAFESLIFLIVILPLAKRIAQGKFHISSKKVDLSIAQYGFTVMVMGCLIMACAQSMLIFILGRIPFSLRLLKYIATDTCLGFLLFTTGCSTRPALQSVLADLVNPEHVAVLYTVIAVGDGVGSAVGALILNRSLAVAIGWNDSFYLGFPFLLAAACFMFGLAGAFFANRALLAGLTA